MCTFPATTADICGTQHHYHAERDPNLVSQQAATPHGGVVVKVCRTVVGVPHPATTSNQSPRSCKKAIQAVGGQGGEEENNSVDRQQTKYHHTLAQHRQPLKYSTGQQQQQTQHKWGTQHQGHTYRPCACASRCRCSPATTGGHYTVKHCIEPQQHTRLHHSRGNTCAHAQEVHSSTSVAACARTHQSTAHTYTSWQQDSPLCWVIAD